MKKYKTIILVEAVLLTVFALVSVSFNNMIPQMIIIAGFMCCTIINIKQNMPKDEIK
jgi:hypothetical protein